MEIIGLICVYLAVMFVLVLLVATVNGLSNHSDNDWLIWFWTLITYGISYLVIHFAIDYYRYFLKVTGA